MLHGSRKMFGGLGSLFGPISRLALVGGTTLLLASCTGDAGAEGPAGAQGAAGGSCTVTDNGDGTKTVNCEDGTTATIADGGDGAAGGSCTVTDNGDGTKTITCEDGTTATIADGGDGAAGGSCTVTDNGDGTKTITCEDGTTVTVSDGEGSARTTILHYDSDIAPILANRCVACHVADYHDLVANPEKKGACFTCHDGTGPGVMDTLRSYPPLSTEAEVLAAVAQGTFTSWIQPGGFMTWDGGNDFDGNPFSENFAVVQTDLSEGEVQTLTQWADSMQKNRQLGYNPNLLATPIGADFDPDGTGTQAAWNTAPELVVALTPTIYTATNELKLKALYSNNYLYIRAEYADTTLSMTRGAWIRDTSANSWSKPADNLPNDPPSEDRIAFLWNKNIPDFKTVRGCAIKCHGNRPGYSCFTDVPGTIADLWHAKANRSLPVTSAVINSALTIDSATYEVTAGSATFEGFLDDKELEWFEGPRFDTVDSGRHGDGGSSTYSHNRNAAKNAPKYMETAPTDFLDAMVLTQAEIDGGQCITADPDDGSYAGDGPVNSAWANYVALNAVVPERILRPATGSRGDVVDTATWSDTNGGTWVHEFKRLLNTGDYDYDVIFDDLYRPYEFSVAVFDNCGRGEIPPGHNTYGNGQYLVLRFLP